VSHINATSNPHLLHRLLLLRYAWYSVASIRDSCSPTDFSLKKMFVDDKVGKCDTCGMTLDHDKEFLRCLNPSWSRQLSQVVGVRTAVVKYEHQCCFCNMVIFSKFKTIPTPCIDYVHPWTESCSTAMTGIGIHALQESFRIYVTVYMVSAVCYVLVRRYVCGRLCSGSCS